MKASPPYRILQGYKVCRVFFSCPGAQPLEGSAEPLESPKDKKGNEYPGRTDLETSTADAADMKQLPVADLYQNQAAISGVQELQFGSQYTAAMT